MKKILIALCLIGGTTIESETATHAQVSIGVNIGRPGWLNAGFRGNFCYLPAIGCYYDVNNGLYYFQNGGNWMGYNSLPPEYAGYNLANFYQVPMYGRNPYMYNSRYYNMYRQYAYMGMPNGGYYRGGGYGGYNYGGGYGPQNRGGGYYGPNNYGGRFNGGGRGPGGNQWNNGGGQGRGGQAYNGGGFNGGGRGPGNGGGNGPGNGGGNGGGGRGFNGRR